MDETTTIYVGLEYGSYPFSRADLEEERAFLDGLVTPIRTEERVIDRIKELYDLLLGA